MSAPDTGTAQTEVGGIRFDRRRNAWLVDDLAVARVVLGRHDLFSTEGYRVIEPDLADVRRFLQALPEHHRRLRRAMARTFAASRMGTLDEALLRPAAQALVDRLSLADTVELQDGYVTPYSRAAMFGVIGIDRSAGDELATMFRVTDTYWRQHGDRIRGAAALGLLRRRATNICRASSASAAPFSLLGRCRDERWLDHGLDIDDVVCLMMSLIEAVAVKVTRDLTATLLRRVAALSHRQQERLRVTGAYVAAADEAVRLQQGGFLPRVATVTTRLGGVTIGAGEQVYVLLGGVGTDRCAFADPQRFDPWRTDRDKAVTFGIGVHRCVGEHVAKAVAARACRSLLERGSLTLVEATDTAFHVRVSPERC